MAKNRAKGARELFRQLMLEFLPSRKPGRNQAHSRRGAQPGEPEASQHLTRPARQVREIAYEQSIVEARPVYRSFETDEIPARMCDRYEWVTRKMLAEYNIRVRKWRSSMSGVAWMVEYQDGTRSNLIEAPRPKGPMSAAVFLHEIGHHAIGFKTYKPRCLEELMAWKWSIAAMDAHKLNVSDAVRKRMRVSIEYAVWKAARRGLKQLPPAVSDYLVESSQFASDRFADVGMNRAAPR